MNTVEKDQQKSCVIWTRVSTKYQEENGGSLDYQKKICTDYAKAQGYHIIGYYGGTHESAKTPGNLIREMKSKLKKDKSIRYVIVSQIDRFSRNVGQGATMFSELLEQDIAIVEATTGLCTSDSHQRLMLQVQLCMSEWDNANRTDKFVRGRKNCLQHGVYCGRIPMGYDKIGKSLNRTFRINEKGEAIRKAFQWKLQGVANIRIAERLRSYGLNLSKQELHKILTNIFYAGKIKHKMLNYEIIDGNQPAIVSYPDFLRVQDILSGRTGVYQHKKETPRFPLKRHVRCDADHTPFTGYTVKSKNIDYYKCTRAGCKTNISAKKLHTKYEELLNSYAIPQSLVSPLRKTIRYIISANQSDRMQQVALLRKRKTEKEKKLKECKIRFGTGEIDQEVYAMTIEALQSEIGIIIVELEKYNDDLSNLEQQVDKIFAMLCKLGEMWRESDLETAQKLQNLLFSDGIFWNKEMNNYRTIGENKAISIIREASDIYGNKKGEISCEKSPLVNLCG